ncbi:MAG: hypothetical protein A2W01_04255 [Candidatus Solincola sediminis]|nr:MAG: hypothetical protein A2W01_04255 [Candidatus Solincola sediminis]
MRNNAADSFLLAAVAYNFGHREDAAALRKLALVIDSGQLSGLGENAAYHELQSLLHLVCEDCSRLGHPLQLPEELTAGWALIHERETIRTTLIHHGAAQALTALEQAGVRAIPLKGFYISKLYDRSGARGFRDLDLLVEKDSLAALNHVLLDSGFQPHEDSPSFVPAPAFTVYYLPIDGSDTGMEIDIHIGMHWPEEYFRRTAFKGQELWGEARRMTLDGLTCWGMSPVHLIITTLLDVSINHRYARLIKFRDLIEVLRKEDLDWDALEYWSDRWQIRSFVAPGLVMLQALYPSLVPPGFAESLLPSYLLMNLFMRHFELDTIPGHRSRSFTLPNLIFFLLGDTRRSRLRGLLGLPSHVIKGRHKF